MYQQLATDIKEKNSLLEEDVWNNIIIFETMTSLWLAYMKNNCNMTSLTATCFWKSGIQPAYLIHEDITQIIQIRIQWTTPKVKLQKEQYIGHPTTLFLVLSQ